MTIPPDIHSVALSPIVEMFELSGYDRTNSNAIFRFCNIPGGVTWQGRFYQVIPVETEGFEFQTSGALPRPSIRVSNVGGMISSLINNYNDLIGAKLTRKRTLAKYLDGQPQADRNAAFPDDIWYVEQKTLENDTVVSWELSSSLDLEGLQLPRRIVVANTCLWFYRGSSCGYTGGAVAKIDDTPTSNLAEDVCGKRIASCKLRFGENAVLPYGGFPSCSRL